MSRNTPIQVQLFSVSIQVCYKISNLIDIQPETHILQQVCCRLALTCCHFAASREIHNLQQVCGVSGFELIMQCDVTRCIFCTSNKVEYLDKEHSHENSGKEVIQTVNYLSYLFNAIKKILHKISFHFKIQRKFSCLFLQKYYLDE